LKVIAVAKKGFEENTAELFLKVQLCIPALFTILIIKGLDSVMRVTG